MVALYSQVQVGAVSLATSATAAAFAGKSWSERTEVAGFWRWARKTCWREGSCLDVDSCDVYVKEHSASDSK